MESPEGSEKAFGSHTPKYIKNILEAIKMGEKQVFDLESIAQECINMHPSCLHKDSTIKLKYAES